jgi:hypothetical protein
LSIGLDRGDALAEVGERRPGVAHHVTQVSERHDRFADRARHLCIGVEIVRDANPQCCLGREGFAPRGRLGVVVVPASTSSSNAVS